MIQLNDEEEAGKGNCRASVEANASVDVFLVIFHFLSGGCFGRPMFHAFDGSFPFFCYFFIITAAYQAWSFYSFVYISLLYQLLWCGHGREGLRVWLWEHGTRLGCIVGRKYVE